MHAAEQTEYPQNIHNPTTILAKAISCLCIRRGKVLQRYNIQSEQPRTEISKDISWGDTGKGFHFVLSVPSLWNTFHEYYCHCLWVSAPLWPLQWDLTWTLHSKQHTQSLPPTPHWPNSLPSLPVLFILDLAPLHILCIASLIYILPIHH